MRWALQMAVLTLLILFFVLQIPRRALFFRPRRMEEPRPAVAFVELDGATYARVMRQMRMADGPGTFRRRSDALAGGGDDLPALEENFSAPDPLPLEESFGRTPAPAAVSRPMPLPPLRPPSLAAPDIPATAPGAARPSAAPTAIELLDLEGFETLKEKDETK